MTGRERGFLLLSSHLGDPYRNPLTPAQLRTLAQRMALMEKPTKDRELKPEDLLALGYTRAMAERIVGLLEEELLLEAYLRRAQRQGCTVVTRVSEHYPLLLRKRLGLDSPGAFWCRGDVELLNTSAISLVGSRELKEPNREFARQVGIHAAKQGLTLISGNARGADREAQEACLRAGGRVVSIVADALTEHSPRENLLYVSEEEFDAPFSAQRAISRNRSIHTMGQIVFVAQASLEKGGTWDGSMKNLHHGWSPVVCFRDGSEAMGRLEELGAYLIGTEELEHFEIPADTELNFFDR